MQVWRYPAGAAGLILAVAGLAIFVLAAEIAKNVPKQPVERNSHDRGVIRRAARLNKIAFGLVAIGLAIFFGSQLLLK